MAGCNAVQMRRWRNTVKDKYSSKMTFLDPVENLLAPETSPYEFVETDLQSIEEADGLLVNMWRESIGAAMGVAHAYQRGRLIVVSDPNHLENKMLTFFADAVVETPLQGAKALWDLLRAERTWRVLKLGERKDEPFERKKIMDAVRAACRDAKRDDIVIPRLVLPRVIKQLGGSDRRVNKSVTVTDIDNSVKDALNELEGDGFHAAAVAGVSDAWQDRGNRPARPAGRVQMQADRDRLREIQVPVTTGSKSHATIWGGTIKRLEDIPSADARRVLQSIASVQHITRITLGPFSRKAQRSRCQAWVGESKSRGVIEGKLFDRGQKGTLQSFQVWVQSDEVKVAVAKEIEAVLVHDGTWAGRADSSS